jgi:hypothetical protein
MPSGRSPGGNQSVGDKTMTTAALTPVALARVTRRKRALGGLPTSTSPAWCATSTARCATGAEACGSVAKAPARLAVGAVLQIDAVFAHERAINGQPAERRLACRREHLAPSVAALEA